MIINIVSPCGGQWRSSLAALLARHLSQLFPGKVLLVDGCSDEGAQWHLGAERTTAYDLGDALCGRCCASDAVFRFGELDIMPSPSDDQDVRLRTLTGLLTELGGRYSFVIYDCPGGSWSFAAGAAEAADVTLLCTMADEYHLNAAYRLRRRLPEEDERCRLVLTGYSVRDAKAGVLCGIDRAIDRVGARLIGVMPAGKNRNGLLADEACGNIARRILGADVPLMKLN